MTLLLVLSTLTLGVHAQDDLEMEDVQDEGISAQLDLLYDVLTDHSYIDIDLGETTQQKVTDKYKDEKLYWYAYIPCSNWTSPTGLYVGKHALRDGIYVETEEQKFDERLLQVVSENAPVFEKSDPAILLNVGETYSNVATTASGSKDGILYTSYDPTIASVDSSGKITALREGMTRIFAKDQTGAENSYSVYVRKNSKTTSFLSTDSVTMSTGTAINIEAILAPKTNALETISSITSSNPNIAIAYNHTSGGDYVVDTAGIVIVAKKAGTTTISCETADGATHNLSVTVVSSASSLTLNKSSMTLDVGKSATLSATNTKAPIRSFLSSDDTIAQVDDKGNVYGISAGTATITAYLDNGKTATCQVTVGSTSASTQAVYRLYNPNTNEHLYTTDKNEYETLWKKYGWGKEGVGWYAPTTGTAVYRLYQQGLDNHLYTTDLNEISVLTSKYGWKKDNGGKPVFYSGGSVPIYRVYNKNLNGLHHLTTDLNEYNTLPKYGWAQEGIKLYAIKVGEPLKNTNYYK